jgi:FKBP-type peptidyl-prolyl cis-trans isomerase
MKLNGHGWRCAGLLLAVGLLTPQFAVAQVTTQPVVPSTPTAPTDTTHHQLQYTQQGVRFVFWERGSGPLPKPGSRVAVRYTGFLPDGHIFDASAASGGPLRFRVGRKEVITGLDELVLQLPVGSRVRAWIPAPLAYGAKGVPDPDDDSRFLIPPNTELLFELLVVSVR